MYRRKSRFWADERKDGWDSAERDDLNVWRAARPIIAEAVRPTAARINEAIFGI